MNHALLLSHSSLHICLSVGVPYLTLDGIWLYTLLTPTNS
jgi:hypothetical protein